MSMKLQICVIYINSIKSNENEYNGIQTIKIKYNILCLQCQINKPIRMCPYFCIIFVYKMLLPRHKLKNHINFFLDKKNKIGNEEENWDILPQSNGTWRLFETSNKIYCSICGKGFNTKTALVQHTEMKH